MESDPPQGDLGADLINIQTFTNIYIAHIQIRVKEKTRNLHKLHIS